MNKPIALIVCNAMDDATRLQRGIVTDSPAASRKVFMLCNALRKTGVLPLILSLGRGKINNSWQYYPRSVRRVDGNAVIYAPFTQLPVFSQIYSLFAFVGTVLILRHHQRKAIIFYNRTNAYIPTLIISSIAGYRRILDLEDGEVEESRKITLKGITIWITYIMFEWLCKSGALLACSALEKKTRIRPVQCYYGIASIKRPIKKLSRQKIHILMSGTISPATGADLLLKSINIMRSGNNSWARNLCFEITGMGSSISDFYALAKESGKPRVIVHGRLTESKYHVIRNRCNIGLALKPVGGFLADTTFPSKIIEFASAGLLVLTTDISDVRRVMGNGAVYLNSNNPHDLIQLLHKIVKNKSRFMISALAGQRAVKKQCSTKQAGKAVTEFLFRIKQ